MTIFECMKCKILLLIIHWINYNIPYGATFDKGKIDELAFRKNLSNEIVIKLKPVP